MKKWKVDDFCGIRIREVDVQRESSKCVWVRTYRNKDGSWQTRKESKETMDHTYCDTKKEAKVHALKTLQNESESISKRVANMKKQLKGIEKFEID